MTTSPDGASSVECSQANCRQHAGLHIKAQTHSEQTELYTSAEAAEAQHLALLLVEVVLRVLHQDAAVTDAALPYAPGILYQILLGTLMASSRCTVMHQISEFSSAKLVKGGESQSCYMVNLKLVATLIVKRALHDAPHTFSSSVKHGQGQVDQV